jgi:hypothetical protein
MAHVIDLKRNQAQELSADGLAQIKPVVKLRADAHGVTGTNADGSINFGRGGYLSQELNLTARILNRDVVVKSRIPILPTNGGSTNNEGDVAIQIANGFKYLGTIQDEAILDPDVIQDAEITIEAECGTMDALTIYKGRVVKAPTEEEGKTTFRTKAAWWDLIDKEIKLEYNEQNGFSANSNTNPLYHLDSTRNLTIRGYTPASGGITFHHGISIWDDSGNLRSSVTNSKSQEVELLRVNFEENDDDEPPLLGKYTIRFYAYDATSGTGFFEVTMPDNRTYTGDTSSQFNEAWIEITPSYWNVIGDPTDAEIEFYATYTVVGNPITIAKNLIYKALSSAWGDDPAEPTSLAVDWTKWAELEAYFNGVTVYVSETNEDNKVFNPFTDSKPLRAKDFIQRVLDHVGCQLTFNESGELSVNCSWYLLPTEQVYTYTTATLSAGDTRKASHSIEASGTKYDRMLVRYGLNPITGDFSGRFVAVNSAAATPNTIEFAFPYFKRSKNDYDVQALQNTLWDIVQKAHVILKAKLKPNWGLPLLPGDKMAVNFTTAPVLPNSNTGRGQYWQIFRVSKRIGGLCEIEAHEIPDPFVPLRGCFWELCADDLCTGNVDPSATALGFNYELDSILG